MNETPSFQNEDGVEASQSRKYLGWLLFALIGASVINVGSLAADITSFRTHNDSLGAITSVTHHTNTSRVVMSAVTLFQLALSFGLIRRSRLAWRAAFALPLVWTFLAGAVAWPQLYANSSDWTVVIPLFCLGGVCVWQTIVWRKQWILCGRLFHRP